MNKVIVIEGSNCKVSIYNQNVPICKVDMKVINQIVAICEDIVSSTNTKNT